MGGGGTNGGVTPPIGQTFSFAEAAPQRTARARLESIDLLRGLVMVLMALDHTRDFFSNATFDPLDLAKTNPALFFTRWITHFCAPVFIFLAGTGAFLAGGRGKTRGELAWFLFTRGLWLAFLEVTYVRCLGWEFNFDFHHAAAAVLWAIGWSMVVLAVLIFLPTWAVTVFGASLIALHNAFDGVAPESWGSLSWLWIVLHKGGAFNLAPGYTFIAAYPLIPWIGVIAVGYGFGGVLCLESGARRRWMLRVGIGLTLLFILLRWVNIYGDPRPWSAQARSLYTGFSFLDCQKYPPSLLYLLMTLGPALFLLAWLDGGTPGWLRPMLVFGRTPLFYYLLHLPAIHGLAVLAAWLRYGQAGWLFSSPFSVHPAPPADNGFPLWAVYLIWIALVVALYPLCKWFAGAKNRSKSVWLSYL